jgi:AcrR family transcriptional regulator
MPPKAGLDKAIVVQAAARLVNTEGAQALNLNRLAQELGVRTPSLYNHVRGMPGLLRELALLNTRLLGDRLAKAAIGRSGPQALWRIAQAYREFINENTGLYLLSLRSSGRQSPVDQELQAAEANVVETCLAVLASFGLEGDDGLHALRGLRSIVHGFATLEAAGGFGLPLDCDESFRRLVDLFIAGLNLTQAA